MFVVLAYGVSASAQVSPSFDYAIASARMFEIDATTGTKQYVDDLGAYLYDIGPKPSFHFEITVHQLQAPSSMANKVRLVVERFILLESKKENHAYAGIDSVYQELTLSEPTWVYSGPVPMDFKRSTSGNTVIFTSPDTTLDFLDPDEPLTFAAPYGFSLHGFAYRFILVPTHLHQRDSDPTNDAIQLTFIKR